MGLLEFLGPLQMMIFEVLISDGILTQQQQTFTALETSLK